MPARFIQLHTLTSYPAALLNRDDAGFAKRLPFGGATRTRVSSQCLKRHWRSFEGAHALRNLASGVSTRSREIFERVVQPGLAEAGLDAEKAALVARLLKIAVLKGEKGLKAGGDKPKKGRKGKAEEPVVEASDSSAGADDIESQVIPIGPKEVAFLIQLGTKIAAQVTDAASGREALMAELKGEGFENLRALKSNAGLDAALFGRMVTSDILARCDAAVHVAHAFTVHADLSEADYFSAVDDLVQNDGELGSGHIGSTELTSGLFYGYVAVDVPLLVANLTGRPAGEWQQADRNLPAQVLRELVHLVATVTPGAKLGSTAPHSFAHLVLAEAGDRQPCTLANAFIPVVPGSADLIGAAYQALAEEACDLDWNYPQAPTRAHLVRGRDGRIARLAVTPPTAEGAANPRPGDLGKRMHLDALATWVEAQVR